MKVLYKKFLVFSVIFMFILLSLAAGSPGEKNPLDSITKAELKDHIYFLASDALQGRDTGSEGFRIAALYAASQFKAAGLKPMFIDMKEKKLIYSWWN